MKFCDLFIGWVFTFFNLDRSSNHNIDRLSEWKQSKPVYKKQHIYSKAETRLNWQLTYEYWNIPLPWKKTGEKVSTLFAHSWNLRNFESFEEATSLKICCSPKPMQGIKSTPVSMASFTKPFLFFKVSSIVVSSPCKASWAPPTVRQVTPLFGFLFNT